MDEQAKAQPQAIASDAIMVREFRQILLWPLHLLPLKENAQIQNHWEVLQGKGEACPWRPLADEMSADPSQFSERHYREFATFLPYVQRMLYGDRLLGAKGASYGQSPIRVFRRGDIAKVRAKTAGVAEPYLLDVIHTDLYFFHDVDVVMLVMEIAGRDLTLTQTQDIMYHFGRAYPSGWTAQGVAEHCFERVEFLDAAGRPVAASDYELRQKFLDSVCLHQVEHIAAHWEYLLAPMAPSQSPRAASIRYRQLKYYRMPLMAWLAVDNPAALTRDDFMRLTFVSGPGQSVYSAREMEYLDDFEKHYCYDRFYHPGQKGGRASTRIMCSGYALIAVGDASKPIFTDPERGFLAQFRHQVKLLGMLVHFQKAALLDRKSVV